MDYNRIAVRYAKALLKAASDDKITDVVYADLQKVAGVAQHDDMKAVLQNPVYTSAKKKEIFKEIFDKEIHALSLRFLFLLIDKNREAFLLAVIRNYGVLYRKEKNISNVELLTAHKAEKGFEKEIKDIIEKKFNTTAELTHRQDESIIGGFVINMEGKQLDAGIKTKLENIRKELTI